MSTHGLFSSSHPSRNVFYSMGYNDRSSQKHKKSGKHDNKCEELSTFSSLKLKKDKNEVDDGRSTKKTKSFDWDDNMLTSTSQEY